MNTPVAITLSCSDAEGDSLTYTVATPTNGAITGTSGNTVTYTPNTGYTGSDTFTYTCNDGTVTSNTAIVSITVSSTTPTTNTAPVANDITSTAVMNTPVAITLSCSDAEGDSLTYTVATPTNGAITGTSGNTVTYTPNTGYTGSDTFTYTCNDGTVTSNTAIVTITVQSDVPATIVEIIADITSADVPFEVSFSAQVTGNSPITYQWDFNNDGVIDSTSSSPTAKFTSEGNYIVTLTIIDSNGDTATDTITISASKQETKSARKKIILNSINFPYEQLVKGEELTVYVNFENNGNSKMKGSSATVLVPELGIRQKMGSIDLSSGKSVTKKFVMEIPEDAQPGFYDVMITIYHDGVKRIKYRTIEIIG